MLRQLLRSIVYLALVCSAAGAALTVTNHHASPAIAENEVKRRRALVEKVLPGTVAVEEIFIEEEIVGVPGGKAKRGTGCARCLDAEGRLIGYAVDSAPMGYAGPIRLIAGLGADFAVSGVAVLESRETPGLGKKAEDEEWLAQFRGLRKASLPDSRRAMKATGCEVDAITASTVTSWAIVKGLRDAEDRLHAVLARQENRFEARDESYGGAND